MQDMSFQQQAENNERLGAFLFRCNPRAVQDDEIFCHSDVFFDVRGDVAIFPRYKQLLRASEPAGGAITKQDLYLASTASLQKAR